MREWEDDVGGIPWPGPKRETYDMHFSQRE
jgi:hypothetical protein